MIRYVVVLRRRDGVDRAAFLEAWLGEHLTLARALPGVRMVAFHPTVDDEDVHDGVGYLEFSSEADLRECLMTEEAHRLREHTATFADPESAIRVVVDTTTGRSWAKTDA